MGFDKENLKETAWEKLFRKYGYHLLASDRDDVQVGDIYERSGDGIDIRSVDIISTS